jgi:hypothetical protein
MTPAMVNRAAILAATVEGRFMAIPGPFQSPVHAFTRDPTQRAEVHGARGMGFPSDTPRLTPAIDRRIQSTAHGYMKAAHDLLWELEGEGGYENGRSAWHRTVYRPELVYD